jgi:hypothetical protein
MLSLHYISAKSLMFHFPSKFERSLNRSEALIPRLTRKDSRLLRGLRRLPSFSVFAIFPMVSIAAPRSNLHFTLLPKYTSKAHSSAQENFLLTPLPPRPIHHKSPTISHLPHIFSYPHPPPSYPSAASSSSPPPASS